MGQHRSPLPALSALAVLWTLAVVVDASARTGDWALVVRHTLLLGSAAGLIGLVAARVDDLIDDMMSGSGGGPRGRRRPVPVRVRAPRRPRGRRHP